MSQSANMTGKAKGRGRDGGRSILSSKSSKRFRVSGGDGDAFEDADTEVLLDSLLGALADNNMMERFVTSLCSIPEVKSKLVEHLLPTLDDQVEKILDPLNQSVADLQGKLKSYNDRCDELEERNDDLEQYTRRTNIRISGIPENQGEDTDQLIIDFAKNALNIDITSDEIDRSHRVGRKPISTARPDTPATSGSAAPVQSSRAIIVRFVPHKSKVKVMKSRKNLKSYNQTNKTNHFVNEDLTKKRSTLAYEARKLKRARKIKDTWVYDGKIFIIDTYDDTRVVTDLRKLRALV